MAGCVTMIECLEEALLGDVPEHAASAVEVEVAPLEKDSEEDPSETIGSSSSVHLY